MVLPHGAVVQAAAARSGRVRAGVVVELELLTERTNLWDAPADVMLGYGARFMKFIRGCRVRSVRSLGSHLYLDVPHFP